MIALLLATKIEARPLLKALGAKRTSRRPYATFAFPAREGRPAGLVLITGMGRSSAAAAAEHLFATCRPEAVLNIGLCGALKADLSPGDLLAITSAVDGDLVWQGRLAPAMENGSTGPWPDIRTGTLATVERPVFEKNRRLALAAHADVVDMEGLAIAQACARHGAPFHALKGVSDRADGGGKLTIVQNIGPVSRKLAQAVLAEMGTFGSCATLKPAVGLGGNQGHPQAEKNPLEGGTPGPLEGGTPGPLEGGTPGPLEGGTHATGSGLVRRIARFAKIEHNLFSLPLLLAGAWLGAGMRLPSWKVLALIAAAGVGARALGMAMNRILDRRLDALNPRTAARELPSGKLSLAAAGFVAAAGLAVYLLACWALGPLCLWLSPLPAIPLIGYSLLKRFTSLCHFGIGLCLAMAPLAAFIAAANRLGFTAPVLLLALFTFCWISGFDILYALQDLDADRRAAVHSIPAALGSARAQVVSGAVHLVAIAAAVGLWRLCGGAWLSGIALAVAVGAFAAGYLPQIPLAKRFFPVSAIASFAGAMIPLLGGLP